MSDCKNNVNFDIIVISLKKYLILNKFKQSRFSKIYPFFVRIF